MFSQYDITLASIYTHVHYAVCYFRRMWSSALNHLQLRHAMFHLLQVFWYMCGSVPLHRAVFLSDTADVKHKVLYSQWYSSLGLVTPWRSPSTHRSRNARKNIKNNWKRWWLMDSHDPERMSSVHKRMSSVWVTLSTSEERTSHNSWFYRQRSPATASVGAAYE